MSSETMHCLLLIIHISGIWFLNRPGILTYRLHKAYDVAGSKSSGFHLSKNILQGNDPAFAQGSFLQSDHNTACWCVPGHQIPLYVRAHLRVFVSVDTECCDVLACITASAYSFGSSARTLRALSHPAASSLLHIHTDKAGITVTGSLHTTCVCSPLCSRRFLSYNRINTLPAGVFQGLATIEYLWVVDTYDRFLLDSALFNIYTCDAPSGAALQQCVNHISLLCVCLCRSLEYNQITTLPAGLFQDATSLKYLWVMDIFDRSLSAFVCAGLLCTIRSLLCQLACLGALLRLHDCGWWICVSSCLCIY